MCTLCSVNISSVYLFPLSIASKIIPFVRGAPLNLKIYFISDNLFQNSAGKNNNRNLKALRTAQYTN